MGCGPSLARIRWALVGDLDHILARLAPTLGEPTAEAVPLSGGITNHNFRVTLAGVQYMMRVHGSNTALLGIDRSAERIASESAAQLGIAPEVVAAMEEGMLTRFVACEQPGAGEIGERVAELAGALRAFHDCGVRLPVRFWVPDLLRDYARIARERAAVLPAAFEQTVAIVRRIAGALAREQERPCHNDLLPGNIIRDSADGRLLIVDWEYAGMGHRYFDLGNLSVNNGFDASTDDRLLAAYHGREPSDRRRAQLKLMRVVSDAREAAWAVVQAGISSLDFDFTGYGEEHFQRLLSTVAQPDFEEWLAAA
jgi:thiamine kinase-like enzyme